MHTRSLSAREWLTEFRSRFQAEVHRDPLSEPLAMAYDKIRGPDDEKRTDVFDPYRSQEWSTAIFVFLARFARVHGLFQEREYPVDGSSTTTKLDVAWLEAWNRTGPPVVAIEHENDSGTEIVRGETRNLLASTAPLRILITYPYRRASAETGTEGIRRRTASALTSQQIEPSEFLLVLGGEDDEGQLRKRSADDWSAYLWSEHDSSFGPHLG